MRAAAITLAILGPLLTFFLGALVTALTLLGSPSTINTPRGYLVTALGAAPGVALSLVAVAFTLTSAVAAGASRGAPSWRSGRSSSSPPPAISPSPTTAATSPGSSR